MYNFQRIVTHSRCFFSSKPQFIKPVLSVQFIKDASINSRLFHRSCIAYQKVEKSKESGSSQNSGNDSSKTKYFLISAGSLLVAGSLYTILYTDIFSKSGEKKSDSKKKIVKIPSDSNNIPKRIPYLLIGGGTASFSAFRAIKSNDPTAKVLVISNELYYPYMRTPLSKEIWFQDDKDDVLEKLNFKQWYGAERSLFYEPADFYISCEKITDDPKGGIAVARGWSVTKLDPGSKKAYLDDGSVIEYEKCLLATGVRPKNTPAFENAKDIEDKVTLFRTVDDFKKLYKIVTSGPKTIAIIGGSFLGTELACALSKDGTSGIKIIQVYPEKGNLAKVLPAYLSSWTTEKIREQKIDVINNADVSEATLSPNKKQVKMKLTDGREIVADHVVVAAGSEVNTELAQSSGLEIDPELGGILVNSELCARSNVYAAGDCACFYDVQLGRRRVEHHDHAIVSGRLAGENMVGAGKIYSHQSMFWSDLGPKITFEAIGIIDSTLPTVAIYAKSKEDESNKDAQEKDEKDKKPENPKNITTTLPREGEDYSKGVIFYLKNDLIVGIVLWNIFNGMPIARQVLKERKKFEDLNEVAKLFNIHSMDKNDS
ncbi:apoptosis-inducing factor 1, mitochondrial [Planococcus citri]|uniref:apoptosis-inducing factor 1, mitochondrial n=1 Tax=Planococcus citri TaxID=170843 RepID=UPI0031F9EC70